MAVERDGRHHVLLRLPGRRPIRLTVTEAKRLSWELEAVANPYPAWSDRRDWQKQEAL